MIRWLLFLVYLPLFIASPGDDLDEFDECRHRCESITCNYRLFESDPNRYHRSVANFNEKNRFDWNFDPLPLPKHLKLLYWTCEQNCDYQCQRLVTQQRVDEKEEVLQFHGKWPFLRVFGIQEFASMIFSIGNLLVHLQGLRKIKHQIDTSPPHYGSYFHNILIVSVVTSAAWICSTIFHIRDFELTERLDYFLAGLTVLTGFHAVFARVYRLYLPDRKLWSAAFTALCVALYSGHVYHLVTDWSYTYNMRANIFIGILQNICWAMLCFDLYIRYYDVEHNHPEKSMNFARYTKWNTVVLSSFFLRSSKLYSLYPLLLCVIVICGMALEIFDFAPIFYDLVDAHSLWHLVTIFPAYYGWYDWMIWDIRENVWQDVKQKAD
ncbi:hypothetical protein PGUG_04760 [Meyerozyma guilliermondii ATCC 6260]|uniref:Post-GPI attachment to proteins factor 3 n=1 Tax=Meyerozyma guilliermondii (strain ATCC 6260 / CBS 566 / DSM 6381 / JCM 1539 / NBRC 10279 / NRRL Y-324) TaxID=294746 RepID=A5DNA9_PICGU|nr:uncharacterized protein PGUG_04760 [Meyerozyma guilliermondii ATCC 6260]EDK40662.2 hypothetical protein PGUG_04760 [Meyerozyma guilliermondii ATCC 6260]